MASPHSPDRAHPLSEAAWHFAPKTLKADLDRARSLPARSVPAPNTENPAEATKSLLETFGAFTEHLTIRNQPKWAMQKHLLQQLSTEKLEAFGIMIKPEIGREPQEIPSFLFKGKPKINWSAGTIDHLGQRFELVEISHPIATQRPLEKPTKSAEMRRGRPRVDEEIKEVARKLHREQSFVGKPEKARVALVQINCQGLYPKLFWKKTMPSPTKVREILRSLGL